MIFAVVEDSRSQAEVLKALLKSEGYQVEVFANGESFLAALPGGGFDFYVIDWGVRGWSFVSEGEHFYQIIHSLDFSGL